MFREEVVVNGKRHIFVFDSGSDDPNEGATLVGVYDAETGAPLPPSEAEMGAWKLADEKLRVGKFYDRHYWRIEHV